jgi:hypothetical protein
MRILQPSAYQMAVDNGERNVKYYYYITPRIVVAHQPHVALDILNRAA